MHICKSSTVRFSLLSEDTCRLCVVVHVTERGDIPIPLDAIIRKAIVVELEHTAVD